MISLTPESVDRLCVEHGWWKVAPIHKEEQAWIESLAKKRNQNGKRSGYKTRTADDKDNWHLSGVIGEFAASLVLNLPINESTGTSSGMDKLDIGGFVEVKGCASRTSDRWNVTENPTALQGKHESTIYVNTLVCLYPSAVVVMGVVSKTMFLKDGFPKPGAGGNPMLVFPWERLARMDDLLKTQIWAQDVRRLGRAARQREL